MIATAAYGVQRAHELAETFFDMAPITAALEFAAEETGAATHDLSEESRELTI
jgi:hypothetical protein